MHKLVILTRNQPSFLHDIQQLQLPYLDIYAPTTKEEIKEHCKDATIFFGNPPIIKDYINQAKNVQRVQSSFAGVDLLINTKLRNDYILTNIKDVYGPVISEYVFGHILSLTKEIAQNKQWQEQKIWRQKEYPSLEGKVLGILGTGSIGSYIAKVGKIFNMNTVGYNTTGNTKEHFDIVYPIHNLLDSVGDIDYLVCALPHTPLTQYIVNKKIFTCMKKTSYFVNIGRGNNVHTQDLIDALKKQEITYAILDVFEEEPLSLDSPLRNLKNITITPHVSGYTDNNTNIYTIFAKNYLYFIAGEPLAYQVNFTKGY